MAKKPGTTKSLAKDFERDLDTEGRPSRTRPGAYNSTNEQQSELETTYRPPAAKAAPRAAARPKPKPQPKPQPKRGPLPPRRPPFRPETPPPFKPPEGGNVPIPYTMPQYDPGGNVTGQDSPPAPGSSAQGWGSPISQIPPMTGPNSDRMAGNAPGTDPGEAWRNAVTMANPAPLPQGQSAASLLFGGGGGPPPVGQPPVGAAPADSAGGAIPLPGGAPLGSAPSFGAMAPQPGLPPPMTGPGADRTLPPEGLLQSLGGMLKRNIPPLRF